MKKVRFDDSISLPFSSVLQPQQTSFFNNNNNLQNSSGQPLVHGFKPLDQMSKDLTSKIEKENSIPVNYRLIYQLYFHYRDSNPQDLWQLICKDYNFVTFSSYTVDDIARFWNEMPNMEKRKLSLNSLKTSSVITNDHSIKSSMKKTRKSKKSIADGCNEADDFSKSTTSIRKDNNDNSIKKQNGSDKDLNELMKEELLLKISILKLTYEFMNKHFEKHYGQLQNNHKKPENSSLTDK